MSNLFPKGATVRLKSGGPCMSVHRYFDAGTCSLDHDKLVECQWFVHGTPAIQCAKFYEAQLVEERTLTDMPVSVAPEVEKMDKPKEAASIW